MVTNSAPSQELSYEALSALNHLIKDVKEETAQCIHPGLFFLWAMKLWTTGDAENCVKYSSSKRGPGMLSRMSFLPECFFHREEKWNVTAMIWAGDSVGKAESQLLA